MPGRGVRDGPPAGCRAGRMPKAGPALGCARSVLGPCSAAVGAAHGRALWSPGNAECNRFEPVPLRVVL
jgi:hypothetical protein